MTGWGTASVSNSTLLECDSYNFICLAGFRSSQLCFWRFESTVFLYIVPWIVLFNDAPNGFKLRTNNTLPKLLIPKTQTLEKYSRSRAYKLSCPDCNKAYVGQTGRSFAQSFKEHKNAFRPTETFQNMTNPLSNIHTLLASIIKQCKTKLREPT